MSIDRRNIIQILRDENDLLRARNKQVSAKLARQQQAFRVLTRLCDKTRDLAETYTGPSDLSDVLRELLEMVLHACDIENGSLMLIDEQAGELEFVAVIGESREYLRHHRLDVRKGIAGSVVESGEPLLITDVRASRQWSRVVDERLNFHTQSLMCVPLIVGDQITGVIEVSNGTTDIPFDENDLNVVRVATRLVGLALERVEQLTSAMQEKS